MLARKHYHTQLLFHHQPKPLGRDPDGRHADDMENKAFVYYVEGDPTPHFEPKGLRHDIEVRTERGHHNDVCFVFYFIISSDLYDAYRGVLSHPKTCWGQDPPEEVMFLRHLYMLTVTSGTFLIAWWRRCAPRITNV